MKIALIWGDCSTCARVKVGAVIVNDDLETIGHGYNGVPSGDKHCEDIVKERATKEDMDYKEYIGRPEFRKEHSEISQYELHAETNALSFAYANVKDATLFVTHSPCFQCSKLIVSRKLKLVIYLNKYDKETKGFKYLKDHGVTIMSYADYLSYEDYLSQEDHLSQKEHLTP